ncbi:10461_t:CDS:2, partial [Acaulospora morrowiae]
EKSEIEELRDKFRGLLKERDELKQILEIEENSKNLREIVYEKDAEISPINHGEFQEEIFQQMVQISNQREYEEFLKAYRLIGRTIFPTKSKRVEMKFETFYRAKYHESHYIILDQAKRGNQLRIFKHTLPHFIPLGEIENDYLNKDVDKFVNIVDDYLQAYVARREEVKLMRQKTGVTNLTSNNAYDLVEFSVDLEESIVDISLTYSNLRSSAPTDVVITQRFEDIENSVTRRKRLKKIEKYFLDMSLIKAFNELFVDL